MPEPFCFKQIFLYPKLKNIHVKCKKFQHELREIPEISYHQCIDARQRRLEKRVTLEDDYF